MWIDHKCGKTTKTGILIEKGGKGKKEMRRQGIRNNIEKQQSGKLKKQWERHSEEDSNEPVRWRSRITYHHHLKSWTASPAFPEYTELAICFW